MLTESQLAEERKPLIEKLAKRLLEVETVNHVGSTHTHTHTHHCLQLSSLGVLQDDLVEILGPRPFASPQVAATPASAYCTLTPVCVSTWSSCSGRWRRRLQRSPTTLRRQLQSPSRSRRQAMGATPRQCSGRPSVGCMDASLGRRTANTPTARHSIPRPST